MSLPYFEANVVEVFKDNLPNVAASDAPYWTRLAVPDGLPIFAEDRAWAEALMAHYNPVTGRCFIVALGTEEMVAPFLAKYPDGIGSGGPNDEDWAREINPRKEFDLSAVEGAGILVLNELPSSPEVKPGEFAGPDGPGPSSPDSSEEPEDEPGESGAPDSGASATEPGTGGSASLSASSSPAEGAPADVGGPATTAPETP